VRLLDRIKSAGIQRVAFEIKAQSIPSPATQPPPTTEGSPATQPPPPTAIKLIPHAPSELRWTLPLREKLPKASPSRSIYP
jgi:hypothetical protein